MSVKLIAKIIDCVEMISVVLGTPHIFFGEHCQPLDIQSYVSRKNGLPQHHPGNHSHPEFR